MIFAGGGVVAFALDCATTGGALAAYGVLCCTIAVVGRAASALFPCWRLLSLNRSREPVENGENSPAEPIGAEVNC